MRKRMSRYTALCILGLACCMLPASVNAQDDLGADTFIVIGPYNPTIADAYKISDFPKVKDAPVPKTELNYKIISNKFSSDFEVVPIKPARIKGEPLQKLYRGYVKIAGGSPGIFTANAFYNSLRSKRQSWGIHLNHFSSAGNVADVGENSSFGETGISLYGKKFVRRHTLSGGLDFDMSKLHYYGFDMTDTVIAALHDSIIGGAATLQRFTTIGGYARLLSHHRDSTALNYDVKFKYFNMTDNYQMMENNFNLSSDFTTYLEKEFIHIHFELDHNDDRFYKDADSMRILTNTVVTLRPQITTGGPRYKFTIGINGVLNVIGDLNGYGRIYPSMYFSYNLVKDIMIPYIGISGGLLRNNIRVLSMENPFIHTDLNDDKNNTSVNNTINSIKFYGGIKGLVGSSTALKSSFNLSATRDKLDNQFFYVNDTLTTLNNQFRIIYDNVALLNLHGEVSLHIKEKIKIMLVGDINKYKMPGTGPPIAFHSLDLTTWKTRS